MRMEVWIDKEDVDVQRVVLLDCMDVGWNRT